MPDGYTLFGGSMTGESSAYYVSVGKPDTYHSYDTKNTDVTPLNITFVDADTGETIKKSTGTRWVEYDGSVISWYTNDGPSGYLKEKGVFNTDESTWKLENGGITVHVKKAANSETSESKEGNSTDAKDVQNNAQKENEQNVSVKKDSKKDSKTQSKGVDTAVATPLAGIFGTMSTALAGMIALLRRKQK